MTSTPRVFRYTIPQPLNPAGGQSTIPDVSAEAVFGGTGTDAVLKAIAGLTRMPVGFRPYGDFSRNFGVCVVGAGGYGQAVANYPDMVLINPYLEVGLEAAAHGPQQSELTEAIQAFTTAASALRDIAENTAKTLSQSQEAGESGAWNIKSAKEKLSQVFDQALVQPQRVTRRGGDAVVLVEEGRYNALTQAAASSTAGMLDAFRAPALRGATLPEVTYPEPLAV